MSEEVTDKHRDDSTCPPKCASYVKYCSDDDRVIKGIFEDHKIRFTQPWALNDPLEFNPTIKFKNSAKYHWFRYDGIVFPSEEWWVRIHLIERRINEFGILSLTKIWDSFDMWSRYANGHKGFLLALKSNFNEQSCMLSPDGRPYPVEEVDYVREYVVDMEELVDDQGKLREELARQQLFFRKLSRWYTEEEYRMVRSFSDLPGYAPLAAGPHRDGRVHLFDLPLDCVELVVFGAYMSIENKRRIMKACEGLSIPLHQAVIIRDEREEDTLGGKMASIETLPVGQFPQLMDMQPFNFVRDRAHFEDQRRVHDVNSLSELPYWEDDSAWVREFYDNRRRRERGES